MAEPKFELPNNFNHAELNSLITSASRPSIVHYFSLLQDKSELEKKNGNLVAAEIYFLLSRVCLVRFDLADRETGFFKLSGNEILGAGVEQFTDVGLEMLAAVLPAIEDADLYAFVADILRFRRYDGKFYQFTDLACKAYVQSTEKLFSAGIDHEAITRAARAVQIAKLLGGNHPITQSMIGYIERILDIFKQNFVQSRSYHNIVELHQALVDLQCGEPGVFIAKVDQVIKLVNRNIEQNYPSPNVPWHKMLEGLYQLKAQWLIMEARALQRSDPQQADLKRVEARENFLSGILLLKESAQKQLERGEIDFAWAKMMIGQALRLLREETNRPVLLTAVEIGSFAVETKELLWLYSEYEQKDYESRVYNAVATEPSAPKDETFDMISNLFNREMQEFMKLPKPFQAEREQEFSRKLVSELDLGDALRKIFERDLIINVSDDLKQESVTLLDWIASTGSDYKGRQDAFMAGINIDRYGQVDPEERFQILKARVMQKLASHHQYRGHTSVAASFAQIEVEHDLEHNLIDPADLSFLFDSEFIPVSRAPIYLAGILAAVNHGDLGGALHLLIPQLEYSLLHILKSRQGVEFDLHQWEAQDFSISKLMYEYKQELQEILGEEVLLNLESLLLFPGFGSNLRNLSMHGLQMRGGLPYTDRFNNPEIIYLCWLAGHLALKFSRQSESIEVNLKNQSFADLAESKNKHYQKGIKVAEQAEAAQVFPELLAKLDKLNSRESRVQLLIGTLNKIEGRFSRQELQAVIGPMVNNKVLVQADRRQVWGMGIQAAVQGDGLKAMHLLIPQIEELLRHLLTTNKIIPFSRDTDLVVSYFTLDRILGEYQQQLAGILGDNLVIELDFFLNNTHGFNLRNRMAHGHMELEEFNRPEVVYVVYLALKLLDTPMLQDAVDLFWQAKKVLHDEGGTVKAKELALAALQILERLDGVESEIKLVKGFLQSGFEHL